MSDRFDTKRGAFELFGSEPADRFQFSSPDQVAIVWAGSDEIVTAAPVPGRSSGSFEMDVARLAADFNFATAIKVRREHHLRLPPISTRTLISTAIPDFSERTRILALDGGTLALADEDLADWLIEAEEQNRSGTDNHPIFENPLDDIACSVVRLPNGQISMTEVPRPHVNAARERISMLLGDDVSIERNVSVETPLRCIGRYFLNGLPEGEDALRPGKEADVTALLLITRSGFSYGLWCPADGLFSEHAFLAPKEIAENRARNLAPPAGAGDDVLDNYVEHVFDQLSLQLTPDRLGQMSLKDCCRLVWASNPEMIAAIDPIAREFAGKTGIDLVHIELPADEAIAGGLLFGSFDFGKDSVVGSELLPRVNLARDLLTRSDREDIERQSLQIIETEKRSNRVYFSLVAAPIIAAAFLLGLVANNIRAIVTATVRDSLADARAVELKPKVDLRNTYESNLKWYQAFVKQVARLRRQQPVGIGLQYELNGRYPLDIDPSFYVSELKLLPTGAIEIKGLARNKDAVTAFLKSLESAGGAKSGTRLFGNLAYEVHEGTATATATQKVSLPTVGSNNTPTALAPGVIAWSVKGNYLPMAEFAPPDMTKKAVPQPAPQTPAN